MSAGAVLVLITGQISFKDAVKAVNPDVLIFLFGMFIVGEAFGRSGFIYHIAYNLFSKARNSDTLLLFIIFSMGLLSPFFINDTMVIVSTPLIIYIAGKYKLPVKPLLLAMAFSVTTGSVMSPTGNPQNLLIALNSGLENPFITFFRYLSLPSVINLFMIFIMIKLFYRKDLKRKNISLEKDTIKDPHLAKLSEISFIITFLMIFLKIISVFAGMGDIFKITYIAIAAALPILIFSPRRFEILKNTDYKTLIFFTSMFVLMQSVWNTGLFQKITEHFNLNSVPVILLLSVIISQFISNVPFVSLYMPILSHMNSSPVHFMALAAGSTIAGNLFFLGAASNIIILQSAEKQNEHISFTDFSKIGIPLTAINIFIYLFFLK
ncbi:MAG: anion transporter [Thermotogae bacterium]|nr:anion transporter [Thermotogota bacterium]